MRRLAARHARGQRCDTRRSASISATNALVSAAQDSDLSSFVGEVSENLRSRPRVELAPDMFLAAGTFRIRSQNVLAIRVDAPPIAKEQWAVTALVDPTSLVRVFELNPDRGDIVALMQRGQKVVAETGANPSDASWLPATEQPVGLEYQVAAAPSRTGATFSYATQPVLGSDFYILSRFDNSAQQAAWLRSFVLVLAPLIMLATLYFAYSRAIQSELLRWIDGIKAAIRQFAAQIVDHLSQSFSRPGLELELKADVHSALMIDRAIPLGLALVESVLAGLEAEDAHLVVVRIGALDDLRVELRVSTDGLLAADRPCKADGGPGVVARRDRGEPGRWNDHSLAVSGRPAAGPRRN